MCKTPRAASCQHEADTGSLIRWRWHGMRAADQHEHQPEQD
jgi:hypothetical protein